MTMSRSITWTCCALSAIVLGTLTGARTGLAQERAGGAPPKPLVDKDHLRMMPEQANPNGNTPIFGLNTQDGFYVYRNHFDGHHTSKPHYHDKDRWVTVIKGTWWTAEGNVFDPSKMVAIKEGGFMFHPANMAHYDGSCDDEGVIVQIMGHGPVKTTQTEVDAKGAPVGANPANTNRASGPDMRGCTASKGGGPARATALPTGR
jgi:hypothetical protein